MKLLRHQDFVIAVLCKIDCASINYFILENIFRKSIFIVSTITLCRYVAICVFFKHYKYTEVISHCYRGIAWVSMFTLGLDVHDAHN